MSKRTFVWTAAALLVASLLCSGCATSFRGDARFPGGVSACRSHCANEGRSLGAFVYVGDYATACTCQDGTATASNAGAAAASAAAVGVMMQMRAAQQQQQAAMMH